MLIVPLRGRYFLSNLAPHRMFYYLKHEVVSQTKYFMLFSKAIIHCIIYLMHASQIAICHLALQFSMCTIVLSTTCEQNSSSQSTRPRAMSPGRQPLQSTRQYVMDKVMVEFLKFIWFSNNKLRHAFCYLK